jgi:ribosomal protein S18 acetylase RimI-like enzyme
MRGIGDVHLERVSHPSVDDLEELARYEEQVFGGVGLRLVDLAVVCEAGAIYRAWTVGGATGRELVGACQLLRTLDEPMTLYLLGFYVLPRWRSLGVGRRFLAALLDELPRLQAGEIVLTVAPENAAALKLYTDAGFIASGAKPGFCGPGEDRLMLRYRR